MYSIQPFPASNLRFSSTLRETPHHKSRCQPVQPLQPDPLLLEAARTLSTMAHFLVIASNSVNMMREAFEAATGRLVLSMIETTIEEVRRRRWRRVGMLTFRSIPVYTEPLRELGMTCETIPTNLAGSLDQAITALSAGIETEHDRSVAREAVAVLRARDVDGIILGCTEIPLLLQEEAADLINPLHLLAEAAVKHALQ